MGSQVDFCHIDQPAITNLKLCTNKVITLLAEV